MKRRRPGRRALWTTMEDRNHGRDVSLLDGSSSLWRLWGEQTAGGWRQKQRIT